MVSGITVIRNNSRCCCHHLIENFPAQFCSKLYLSPRCQPAIGKGSSPAEAQQSELQFKPPDQPLQAASPVLLTPPAQNALLLTRAEAAPGLQRYSYTRATQNANSFFSATSMDPRRRAPGPGRTHPGILEHLLHPPEAIGQAAAQPQRYAQQHHLPAEGTATPRRTAPASGAGTKGGRPWSFRLL